jgi:hypothetical protein
MWTRISATVLAGSRTLPLQQPVQWRAGDRFFITTTAWKDELNNQNEVLTVASVSADGRTLTTVEALQFNHYGGEYQAEVGLLTRRVLFTSDAASRATGIGERGTLAARRGAARRGMRSLLWQRFLVDTEAWLLLLATLGRSCHDLLPRVPPTDAAPLQARPRC